MDKPIRQYQKQKDYQRHKLFRKMKRRRKAEAELESLQAIKMLKRKLKVPKFGEGKDPFYDYAERLAKKLSVDWNVPYEEVLTHLLNTGTWMDPDSGTPPEYDYRAFYEDNPQYAEDFLNAKPGTHFTDVGKTYWHPTFSNESKYSGKVSDENPTGAVGGLWLGNNYMLSEDQIKNNWNVQRTIDYIKRDTPNSFVLHPPKYEDGKVGYRRVETGNPVAFDDDGFIYDTGTGERGRITLPEVVVQPTMKTYRDVSDLANKSDFIASNDAIQDPFGIRSSNEHLSLKARRGERSAALWAQEHPNLYDASLVAGAIPFAVASAPAVVPAMDTVAASSVGSAITAGLTNPYVDAALLSAGYADALNSAMRGEFGYMNALEMLPLPGTLSKVYANGTKMLSDLKTPAIELADAVKTPQITAENAALQEYEILDYPGYLLKLLMRGNTLEKLLSKNGTISVNGIRAHINKGSTVEKAVVDKVLASDRFAGQKKIDYNLFRKAVQDELITYNRVPSKAYLKYGFDRLGFQYKDLSSNAFRMIHKYKDNPLFKEKWLPREIGGKTYYADMTENVNVIFDDYEVAKWIQENLEPANVTFDTFTFESPRIPIGSDDHYNASTLGHSRTYTTTDEPEVLHVMESLSDWGQKIKDISPRFTYKRHYNGNTNIAFDKNGKFYYTGEGEGMPYKDFVNLDLPTEELPFAIAKRQFVEQYPIELVKYLHDNYLQRQLQENLRYAAEHGQTKVRYPTRETAVKIEGYKPVAEDDLNFEDTPYSKYIDDLKLKLEGDSRLTKNEIATINSEIKRIQKIEERWIDGKATYAPLYETVLDKYSEFPKRYRKLYKDAEVRVVTDNKGNTWYEVDVPKNYLNSEWLYGLMPLGLMGTAAYSFDYKHNQNGKGVLLKPNNARIK